MSEGRGFRWATSSTRLLIGTVVSAAFAIGVVTAVSAPWPTLSREPVALSATAAPEASTVSCNGPLLVLGQQAEQAAQLSAAATPTVTSGVASGAADPTTATLASPDLGGAEAAQVFTAEPADGARTDVAASTSASVRTRDLTGFAASACRPPLMESWLVGGAGTTGASDLVVLSNPGVVAASVQLTLYGATGASTPPGGELVIAPGTQRILPLAGLALGEGSPVVRVSATGAGVQASLQTSLTRTLVPGGVDQVGAIAQPEQTLVIPGIQVTGSSGQDDASTILRVLSPSTDTDAQVTVVRTGSATPVGDPIAVKLTAGRPAEVEIPSLPDGGYTVRVQAQAPVVGAVWQTTGFGAGSDFAWYTPADEITTPTLFATPAGTPPTLTLVNDSDAERTVSFAATDGSVSTQAVVAAGATAQVALAAREVYTLEAGGSGIRAAVSYAAAGALAGFPVWPADAATPAITVYP